MLWQSTFSKAKGAAKILQKFGELNKEIYLYGTTKRLHEL